MGNKIQQTKSEDKLENGEQSNSLIGNQSGKTKESDTRMRTKELRMMVKTKYQIQQGCGVQHVIQREQIQGRVEQLDKGEKGNKGESKEDSTTDLTGLQNKGNKKVVKEIEQQQQQKRQTTEQQKKQETKTDGKVKGKRKYNRKTKE